MAKRKRTKGNTTLQKTKDRAKRNPLTTGVELRWPGRESSYCFTRGTKRVTQVKIR